LKASLTQIREIVKQLESHDLIEIQKRHKIKHLVLTERGRRIAASLQEVKCELNGVNQNEPA
jgi:predicted transcriptional regulator